MKNYKIFWIGFLTFACLYWTAPCHPEVTTDNKALSEKVKATMKDAKKMKYKDKAFYTSHEIHPKYLGKYVYKNLGEFVLKADGTGYRHMKRLVGKKYVFDPKDKKKIEWGILLEKGMIKIYTTYMEGFKPSLIQFWVLIVKEVDSGVTEYYKLFQTKDDATILARDSKKGVWYHQL